MNIEQERINNPVMEYYRHVYSFSKKWNGKQSLENKKVIVYCEQGYGDIIQFLRYIKPLKSRGCEVCLHIPKELHPLMPYVQGVDTFLDKQNSILPQHDYHILSLSLPFLLDIKEISSEPYIDYKNKINLEEKEGCINIGIAWEGSPEHSKNLDRCCPLKHFKILLKDNVNLFMLQDKIYMPQLVEDVDFDLYSININDFGDTASLINSMDFVVTVDTSILHLSGAMGKRTYAILGEDPDPRWQIAHWYDSVTLLSSGSWEYLLNIINNCRK